MKLKYSLIEALFLLLITTTIGVAQTEVSGTVRDADTGETLVGVNILVKGTTVGASTNINGQFSLRAQPTDTLVFRYLSFEQLEVPINGRTNLDIELIPAVIEGVDLVVVGYGTQTKKQVTGSVSSVDMTEINTDLPNISLTQSIGGVAGVQFTGDGRPGQGGDLLIRGQSSLSGGNEPLIVLDGIIFGGSLNDINPQDIASIDILKDASSTAIYGSRAANGVVLVTTKKGTTQEPTVSINLFSGISQASNQLELLSPERYIERRLDWREQSGLVANPNDIASYLSPTEAQNYANGTSRNPWDVIAQDGSINSMDISVSGRNERINYYLSAANSVDKGLVLNDNQERVNLRTNLDIIVTEWLNIGTNTTFSKRDMSGISANVNDAYRNSPYGTWYYDDGAPTEHPVASEQAADNPVRETILTKNEEIYNNLFSNLYAELYTGLMGGQLTYRVNYSPNLQWNHNYNYMRQDDYVTFNNTYAEKYNENSFNWVLENILSYKKMIGANHSFDVTLLYGRNHSETESSTALANQLSIDGLGYDNLELGGIATNSSYAQEVNGISYMGRINYELMSKYLFTFTMRRDGSSVFSANNKYAVFPSGAFAWVMSDEKFMESAENIDLLKLRVSYGAVGNQAIEPYQSLSLAGTERYVFGNAGNSELGVVVSSLGNNNLKWETTYSANAAIDFEIFSGRIGGSIEYYNSRTEDLIVRRNIPVTNGFSSVLTNIGETSNKGLEVVLNTINVQKSKLTWSNSFSFTYNKNEIVHLFGTDLDGDGQEDDNIANSWFIGSPINSYYDYEFDGIYQEGDNDIPAGSQPGFVRVRDLNGDGVITPEDRTVVASGGSPEYQLGLTNKVSYGNFDFTVFVNAMLGWDAPFNLINPLVPGRALNQVDAGWWTSENQSNTRPSLVYSNPLGTNWYSSRNFLRVKDVSLSYRFNEDLISKVGVSSLKIFASVKNLYTITNWLGSDPESGGEYFSEQGSSDLYPMPRTFAIGLNMQF